MYMTIFFFKLPILQQGDLAVWFYCDYEFVDVTKRL